MSRTIVLNFIVSLSTSTLGLLEQASRDGMPVAR